MGVGELKSLLNLEGQYKQFPLFKLRVLDRAQQELSKTDLPFTYELLREGKAVAQVRFHFPLLTAGHDSLPLVPLAEWEAALQQAGLSATSLATVAKLVGDGKVDPEYVAFVVRNQREKYRLGKVKSLPGSIFSAIVKGHLLAEFQEISQRHSSEEKRDSMSLPSSGHRGVVRFRLREVEAMYQTLVDRELHKHASFEEHIEQVYLQQGFMLKQDANQEKWLEMNKTSS